MVTAYGSTYRVPNAQFVRHVWLSRIVLIICCILCCVHVEQLNLLLAFVWEEYLRTSSIFKHDSFEPLLSTVVFGVVMFSWYVVDFHVPYLHRYRISTSDDISTWMGRQSAFWNETFWYISPWLVIDYFIPRRKLPLLAPTFPQMVLQIVLALVLFDLFFFVGHVCFHSSAFLYKHVHAVHHTAPIIRATDTIRHTFWDGTWDVVCSVLALNLQRAHPLSRAVYNIIAIYLITEAHSGMNFPWGLHNVLPFHIMAGPIVHDIHHRNGKVNFQKYFTHLDYLFGTLKIEPRMNSSRKED